MGRDHFVSEYEALASLVTGKLEAFNYIYYKYSDAIYVNICKYIKQEALAEDLLQEVFLILWEKRATLRTDIAVGGWLYTVSYNKSIALLKKQLKESLLKTEVVYHAANNHINNQLHPLANDFGTGFNPEQDYQTKVRLLEQALQQLPAKKQKVYRLSKFEHKKPEEISNELGLTVISVKHYIKQSTKLIKQYVQLRYPIDIIILCISLHPFLTNLFKP